MRGDKLEIKHDRDNMLGLRDKKVQGSRFNAHGSEIQAGEE